MDYQTFPPHSDLASVINCYWSLEVPANPEAKRQRIVPDGCIEMAFILGDDIKRYTDGEAFILQPRAMILGQTLEPFDIEPTGYVNTFAVRFYPYGFTNFVDRPLQELANTETPLSELFEEQTVATLTQNIIQAANTSERIALIESFLFEKLNAPATLDHIVKTTLDALLHSKGSAPINSILKADLSKRRQLERKFSKEIGISPKQLGKIIRLQAALKMLLNEEVENLTRIAYESEYYDQAHFIKDFKEFTGTNPKEFLGNESLALSTLFYK